MKRLLILSLFLYAFWIQTNIASTACPNGTILFKEDFGGNDPTDLPIKATGIPQVIGYTYNSNTAGDGRYSIRKQGQSHSVWIRMDDHTYPNDLTKGYLMEVDGSTDPSGQFYMTQIDNLCVGSTLYFSMWAASISPGYSEGDLSIVIEDINGVELTRYNTNAIPTASNINDWKQFGISFTITGSTPSVIFKIMNNNHNYSGNDFVLDDIEIRLCVPPVTVSIIPNDTVCVGDNIVLNANFTNDGTFTEPLVYKWFKSDTASYNPTDWTEIGTGVNFTINSAQTLNEGYYRVAVASTGSINLENCRAMSDPVFLKVNVCGGNPPTNTLAVNKDTLICLNSSVELLASGAASYQWTPATSLNNPAIPNPTASPTSSTTYTVTGTFSDGTTQTKSVMVNVINPKQTNITEQICSGTSYTFNGKTFNSSGVYKDTLLSSIGCDSIVTLNLSVKQAINESFSQKICSGDYFLFGNDKLEKSGTYQKTFQSISGCDSIVSLNLEVIPIKTLTQFKTVYNGEGYIINNHEYKKGGVYIDTLKNNQGCDNIIITNLTFILASYCPEIEIPIYFTPNADGLNDKWIIKNIECYVYHEVEIYDRFGKMLRRWNDNYTGWDGTYLDIPMPSDDYWYIIKLNDRKEPIYVGHFTLKR